MSIISREELQIEAEKIADIVSSVDHRVRGDFLWLVAECLEMKGQYYTTHSFKEAARTYGMKLASKEVLRK